MDSEWTKKGNVSSMVIINYGLLLPSLLDVTVNYDGRCTIQCR